MCTTCAPKKLVSAFCSVSERCRKHCVCICPILMKLLVMLLKISSNKSRSKLDWYVLSRMHSLISLHVSYVLSGHCMSRTFCQDTACLVRSVRTLTACFVRSVRTLHVSYILSGHCMSRTFCQDTAFTARNAARTLVTSAASTTLLNPLTAHIVTKRSKTHPFSKTKQQAST